MSLLALGSHIAQRWRGQLPESREVKAFVDSGPEMLLTPGPVEQLLDSVLRDVSESGAGPVMIRFAGQDEHVRVTVRSGSSDRVRRRDRPAPSPSPRACAPTPTWPAPSPRCSAAATPATRRSTSSRSCCPRR